MGASQKVYKLLIFQGIKMVKKDLFCTSCKSKLIGTSGSVKFKCPGCDNETIVRCSKCRNNSINYICKDCSFRGPN